MVWSGIIYEHRRNAYESVVVIDFSSSGSVSNLHHFYSRKQTVSYNFEQTVGGQLVEQYRQELMEAIEVPNHLLPEEYRNEKTGLRSLAELDTMHAKEHGPTQHQIDKAAKAQRVENYRQQWEDSETIEYDVDDDRQYRIEVAFVKGAVDNGWVEIDEDET